MTAYSDWIVANRSTLVGLWLLDEASGATASEAGGPAGDATYQGASIGYHTSGPTPAIPYGITTTGASSGYIQLPSLTGLFGGASTAQSYELWFRRSGGVTNATTRLSIFGSETNNTAPLMGGSSTSDLSGEVLTVFNDAGGNSDRTGWTTMSLDGNWHHIVVTYSGTQGGWTLYVDGVTAGTITQSSGGAFGLLGSATYYLGRSRISSGAEYDAIDVAAVAIYSSELSSTEVAENYDAAFDLIAPVVQGSAAFPSPSIQAGSTVLPASHSATASVPSPTAFSGILVTPPSVSSVATILAPSISSSGEPEPTGYVGTMAGTLLPLSGSAISGVGGGSSPPPDTPDFVVGVTKPDSSNTGPRSPTTTTIYGSGSPAKVTYSTPNQVITNTRFECFVDMAAANVTFRDCEFVGPSSYAFVDRGLIKSFGNPNISNLLVEFCLFEPQTPQYGTRAIVGHSYTVSRCEIRGTEDGFNIIGTTGPVVIEANYVHDLQFTCPIDSGDNTTHCDCIQVNGNCDDLTIRGNNLQGFIDPAISTYEEPTWSGTPFASTQLSGYTYYSDDGSGGAGGLWVTTCLIFTNFDTTLNDVTVEDNWMDGGALAINFGAWTSGTNLSVTGNRWGRDFRITNTALGIKKVALTVSTSDNIYEDDETPENDWLAG